MNTSYFHACLKKRKEENRIATYLIEQGRLIDNFPDVVSHYLDHFRSSMGSPSSATTKINLQCVELGHDGFGSAFFKVLWLDIGGEICRAVGHFFETRIFPVELHNTTLSLVPKTNNPSRSMDYRPIACCSTIYKCISKLLCSRLAMVLPDLVQPNKGWIMTCLKNTTYSLLMNGRVQGSFKGEKGLRQGDPMSPLLFVLIMEYLTRSLQLAAQDSTFRLHPMCKSLKLLSLCFADDLFLFCKGSLSAVRVLKVALEEFSSATGVHVNTSKSHIFFRGVNAADKQTIAHEIQLAEGTFPLKYLGVPMRPTKWKHEDCDIIIQNIKMRLHTWASRHLPFAGRIQLIHSVLFGLRNYWMRIFVLPQSVVKEVEKLFHGFLWGITSASWKKFCLPKAYGGLGFMDGSNWNRAILTKYIWAISEKHDLLWVKWINSIYLKDSSFWNYKLKHDLSWDWRKLCHLRGKFSLVKMKVAGVTGIFKAFKLYNSTICQQQVGCHQAVWCRLSIPKHHFLLWQVVNSQLLTRDNMLRFCIPLESLLCSVCGFYNDSHTHLFFECYLFKKVTDLIFAWMGFRAWPNEFTGWTVWLASRRLGIISSITNMILAAIIYYLWRNQNRCMFDGFTWTVGYLAIDIMNIIQYSIGWVELGVFPCTAVLVG
ncbi:uncharacterized protein LOC133779740 [Humulus lupulus]|uniref:uncharacterized protein LOC133779740 n=1 Tax=Humulus lupulus TaxID=3486 RepID=UPI002B40BAF6|nr:uncharacterized protein LOC133779740 [Humulus lupulus]